MKQLRIGRNQSNDLVLNSIDVSGLHAVITQLSENVFLIEDNDSLNGTFINGQRIKRTTFTKKDNILLARTPLTNSLVFKSKKEKFPIEKDKLQESEDNYYTLEFKKLEFVYKAYLETKEKLQNNQSWISTGLRVGLSFIPIVGFGLGILASGFLRKSEKLAVLNEEFKIHYVCPKCKRFLGNIPFQGLVNMKKHLAPCNAIWVE